MATLIDRKTIELMKSRYQKELDDLFAEQESSKRYKGTIKKAQGGATVPGSDYDPTLVGNYKYVSPVETYTGIQEPWTIGAVQTPEDAFNAWDRFQVNVVNPTVNKLKSTDWGNTLNTLGTISPILYNTYMGLQKPKQFNPRDFYNPYANQVASLMRNRRVNVDPQLNAVRESQLVANYNAKNVAGSRGNVQGNYAAIGNTAMRNKAAILANKENMDLEYKGQEAQMLNNEGLSRANINWNVANWNEQAKANKRNYLATAAGQTSQLAQINKLMGNQLEADKYRAGIWGDMYGNNVGRFMGNIQEYIDYLNSLKRS